MEEASRAASELSETLRSAYGPLARAKLITTPARNLVSSSGHALLRNARADQPLAQLIRLNALALADATGEGASTFVLMLAAFLRAAQQDVHSRPQPLRRRRLVQLSSQCSRLLLHTLPRELEPAWRACARAVPRSAAELRASALAIARTSLGCSVGAQPAATIARVLTVSLLGEDRETEESASMAQRIALARRRAASSLTIVSAAGASASHSFACGGLVVRASSLPPPAAGTLQKSVGVVVLGRKALPVEAGVEARGTCSLAATLEIDERERAGGMAQAVEAAAVERRRWTAVLRAAGVGVVVSNAPLPPEMAAALAVEHVRVVAGVDVSSLWAFYAAARLEPLRRWPHSAQLEQLLAPPSRHVASCGYEGLRIGGVEWLRLVPSLAPSTGEGELRTAILRAPSDGLASLYAVAAKCALTSLRNWLGRVPSCYDAAPCHVVSGSAVAEIRPGVRVLVSGLAGRAELNGSRGTVLEWESVGGRIAVQLDEGHRLLVKPQNLQPDASAALAAAVSASLESEGGSGEPPLAAAGGGACEMQLHALASAMLKRPDAPSDALCLLCEALLCVPRVLHVNAGRLAACAGGAHGGQAALPARWLPVERQLRLTHAAASGSQVGLVHEHDTSGGSAMQRLANVLDAGVLHPYESKRLLVEAVVSCAGQLLRLDGMFAAGCGVRRMRATSLDSESTAGESSSSDDGY